MCLKNTLSTFSEVVDDAFEHWSFEWLVLQNISTTVHATTKLFVPFCSAQDSEFIDIKYLVFWAHCKNGKILVKCQVYNKGFSPILAIFYNVK